MRGIAPKNLSQHACLPLQNAGAIGEATRWELATTRFASSRPIVSDGKEAKLLQYFCWFKSGWLLLRIEPACPCPQARVLKSRLLLPERLPALREPVGTAQPGMRGSRPVFLCGRKYPAPLSPVQG